MLKPHVRLVISRVWHQKQPRLASYHPSALISRSSSRTSSTSSSPDPTGAHARTFNHAPPQLTTASVDQPIAQHSIMPSFKSFKRSRRDEESDGEGSAVEPAKPQKATKKAKTGTATVSAAEKDAEGNSFWPVTATRRVVLSEFKGKPMVSIREYYKDSAGDLKPGKKGITLPLEQWNAVVKAIPQVNSELAAHGHDVADVPAGPAAPAEDAGAKENRKKEKAKKANIEATSDEGEDDASD